MNELNDINADAIREVLNRPDPILEALALLLKEVAVESVAAVASVLNMLGWDHSDLPGEYLVQAILVEANKVFTPVSRDNWIKVFDSYEKVKAVIDANPDLKLELDKSHEGGAEARLNSILDGKF